MKSPTRTRVLVLGGTGFIGSAVMNVLLSRKHEFEVMLLGHRNINYHHLENVNLITGSLRSFDLAWLEVFRPDFIIHMARLSGKGRWGRYFAAKNGAKANERLINHLTQSSTPPRVIYVSGTLVYGDCGDKIVREEQPVNPVGFAREYIVAERPWMKVLEDKSLPVNIVRPPWIIGRSSWFKHFYVDYIRENMKIPVYGEGTNWMSLIDVEDCAGLIVQTMISGEPGKYYNLSSPGYYIRQLDFAQALSQILGLPLERLPRPVVIRNFSRAVYEAFSFSVKSDTSHRELVDGYTFRYPAMKEMIARNLSAIHDSSSHAFKTSVVNR